MAVKIRLARIGKKNEPFYRIVAIDSRSKRDGKSLEILGTYNPRSGELVQFNQERIDAWIKVGAIATDSVKRLQKVFKKQSTSSVAAAA
jgi:small subunit ribosomal protein S16